MKKEDIKSLLEKIDERICYAYDAIQKLESIENKFGLKNLEKVLPNGMNNKNFHFFDNLQALYNSAMDNLVIGICCVYDNDSKANSFKSVLNVMINDLKMTKIKNFSLSAELNNIKTITDTSTMNPIYKQLKELRDKEIAHSEKNHIGTDLNLDDVKKFLNETIKRAKRIFDAFDIELTIIDFNEKGIKNPMDDFFDKYKWYDKNSIEDLFKFVPKDAYK